MVSLAELGGTSTQLPRDAFLRAAATVEDAAIMGLSGDEVETAVLYDLLRGQPLVIVDSPPGAGKSTLIANICWRMHTLGTQSITVAVPTHHAARDLAQLIAARFDPSPHPVVSLPGGRWAKTRVPGVSTGPGKLATPISVRTVASCRMSPPSGELLIFDEAYQTTVADALVAANEANQVLLVGDPGQIGPVNALSVEPWQEMEVGPHDRAPMFFAAHPHSVTYSLPTSYRLGKASVRAISPLYDFSFASGRGEICVAGHHELASLELPVCEDPADYQAMTRVIQRCMDLLGATINAPGKRGVKVAQEDISIIAARNTQISRLEALLSSHKLAGVSVGTADSLQGSQFACVISIDPYFGAPYGSDHSASLERLCVMASRHFAHLTWAYSPDFQHVITDHVSDPTEAATHLEVRSRLIGCKN